MAVSGSRVQQGRTTMARCSWDRAACGRRMGMALGEMKLTASNLYTLVCRMAAAYSRSDIGSKCAHV